MRTPLVVRMSAPVIAVSVLLLAVGLITAWYVERLQQNAARVVSLNVASIRAVEELEIGLRKIRSRVNTYRLTGVRDRMDEIPVLRRDTDRLLEEAVRISTTEQEKVLMVQVNSGYERFFVECDRLIRTASDGDRHEELWATLNEVLHEELLEPAHQYIDLNAKMMTLSTEQSEAMAERMVLALLLLGTTGPVAGLLAGFGIARGVSRSIVQLHVPIRNAAGKLNEVVGPITVEAGAGFEELETELRTITEHMGNVVERLQQSQREVLRAEQLAAVGQLAAGVAHELRNPLMSITLLVQSASKQGKSACLRGRDLDVLQVATARLERSLQSLLDFARPSKPEKQIVELREVLEETINLVSGRAASQSVEILSELPDETVTVEADTKQLQQLLLNLLLNALDAVAVGGTVKVCVDPDEIDEDAVAHTTAHVNKQTIKQDRWLTIKISDTGCGLPAVGDERIFEPFVSSKDTGTGLGLTISRRIVEAHGGELLAANRPEGGAVFTVKLPRTASREVVPVEG